MVVVNPASPANPSGIRQALPERGEANEGTGGSARQGHSEASNERLATLLNACSTQIIKSLEARDITNFVKALPSMKSDEQLAYAARDFRKAFGYHAVKGMLLGANADGYDLRFGEERYQERLHDVIKQGLGRIDTGLSGAHFHTALTEVQKSRLLGDFSLDTAPEEHRQALFDRALGLAEQIRSGTAVHRHDDIAIYKGLAQGLELLPLESRASCYDRIAAAIERGPSPRDHERVHLWGMLHALENSDDIIERLQDALDNAEPCLKDPKLAKLFGQNVGTAFAALAAAEPPLARDLDHALFSRFAGLCLQIDDDTVRQTLLRDNLRENLRPVRIHNFAFERLNILMNTAVSLSQPRLGSAVEAIRERLLLSPRLSNDQRRDAYGKLLTLTNHLDRDGKADVCHRLAKESLLYCDEAVRPALFDLLVENCPPFSDIKKADERKWLKVTTTLAAKIVTRYRDDPVNFDVTRTKLVNHILRHPLPSKRKLLRVLARQLAGEPELANFAREVRDLQEQAQRSER